MSEQAVTRTEIVDALRRRVRLSRTQALSLLEAVLAEVAAGLKKGEEVKIPLFGVFYVRHKKERMGRNPKTLSPATIAARRVACFRVSRMMKGRVHKALSRTQKLG